MYVQDHLLWAETIVHQLPVIGPFYIAYVRRWIGLGIVYLMYSIKILTTTFDYIFAQTNAEVTMNLHLSTLHRLSYLRLPGEKAYGAIR